MKNAEFLIKLPFIKVNISPYLLITVFTLAISGLFSVFTLIVILCALFHGLGHISAMKLFKVKIYCVDLYLSGGIIRSESALLPYKKELAVAFSGIFANLVFALGASGLNSLAAAVTCIFIAAAAQNSACNLIYAVFVFRFKATGKISSLTGGLDSSAYVASAVGTKTIGLIAVAIGWDMTVGIWGIVAGVGMLACIGSALICRKNGAESVGE